MGPGIGVWDSSPDFVQHHVPVWTSPSVHSLTHQILTPCLLGWGWGYSEEGGALHKELTCGF